MPIDFAFRKAAVRNLTQRIGVYVLCDLDETPVYVGQSKDGIRALFHQFNPISRLINETIPPASSAPAKVPKPASIVQVMSDLEIAEMKDPELRLPRQAKHYADIIGHFLAV